MIGSDRRRDAATGRTQIVRWRYAAKIIVKDVKKSLHQTGSAESGRGVSFTVADAS